MTFGEKVRAKRKQLGLTQEELSQRINVSRRIVTSYEADKSRPRGVAAYKRLAVALDVNVNHLLNDDEAFIESAGEQFGSRGRAEAKQLVDQLTGLFAGGEMAEADMDALMFSVQEAYVFAKNNNKKYTPKKYLKDTEENTEE